MDDKHVSDANTLQSQRQHIFAVNHDPEFLDVVRVLLQGETYNVTTTNYVPRTWDQIAALQPSLLLIDLHPVQPQDGLDLLEHLRREGIIHTIPIIVTSTDHRLLERIEQDKDRYGGDRFVVKPLDIEELLKAIDILIGSA
jgi:CheY-like chemotaxis protein